MPTWLRVLTMLVVLAVWSVVVAVSLLQGTIPDAATLGIPAAIVIALAPPGVLTRRRRQTPARRGRRNADEDEPTDEESE